MNLLESEGFPLLLKRGRWALALTETSLSLFMALWFRNRPPAAWLAMVLLFGYNIAVLILLHRLPIHRIRVHLLLVLDLIFLANVSYYTGATDSPFLGQSYLIVFVGALFFDLKGGLGVGFLAALIMVGMALLETGQARWEVVRDTAPYFVIVGGFTGFLVAQMKVWFGRYRASAEREASQHQTELARQREMELAREVQRTSLPLNPPVVPGLALALRTQPSREVGGDFHVFVPDPAGSRLGLAVGDVAGKGMAAALIATSIGYLLPYLEPLRVPHAALQRLNADLCERLPEASFATLLYAELGVTNGTLRLWNAGHPPALLWRVRDGRIEDTSCGVAPPLGMFAIWRAPEQELQLAPGDVVLIHSDGVLDVQDAHGERFGEERLRRVMAEHASGGPKFLTEALLAALRQFGELTDDLTLVAFQRQVSYPG